MRRRRGPDEEDAPAPIEPELLVHVGAALVTRHEADWIKLAAETRDDLPPKEQDVLREYLARLRQAAREQNHVAVIAIKQELELLALYKDTGLAGGRKLFPAVLPGRASIGFRRVLGGAAPVPPPPPAAAQ